MVLREGGNSLKRSSRESASLTLTYMGKYKVMPQMHSLLLERSHFPKKHFTLGFIFP